MQAFYNSIYQTFSCVGHCTWVVLLPNFWFYHIKNENWPTISFFLYFLDLLLVTVLFLDIELWKTTSIRGPLRGAETPSIISISQH